MVKTFVKKDSHFCEIAVFVMVCFIAIATLYIQSVIFPVSLSVLYIFIYNFLSRILNICIAFNEIMFRRRISMY